MLPDAQDAPVGPPQGLVHEPVTRLVAGNLVAPESGVAFRLRSVLGTAVPEAAIHKNREPKFGENEIRLAEDFLIPPPAGDFVPPK